MISDVLSDAEDQLRDYQQTCPGSYAHLDYEIEVVATVMTCLRTYLDAAPLLDAEYNQMVEDIRLAVRGLDIAPLLAARERLLTWARAKREGKSKDDTQPEDLPSG